jgi:hypothetical protein
MTNKISKNLEELIYSLIQDQINEEASKILKIMISIQNSNNIIKKSLLIKDISINIDKEQNINGKNIVIENIIQTLINLNYIEYTEPTDENIIIKIYNILNILIYPRYCYYINSIYGPKCLKIIEYLLEFGFYSLNNNQNQKINFERNDFQSLVRDGIIIKYNYQKTNIEKGINTNNNIFNSNIKEIYKINYNLLNRIIFKEYIINYYKQYISMNFNFYELFKKLINSDNYTYELKNYEQSYLDNKIIDNYDYDKLIIKENNKLILNKDIIKYDLFYNSLEKILNILFSPKHIRILRIIQRYENLNSFQISQKASLKKIEVEEILDDLINKVKIVKKENNKDENNNENTCDTFCLNEINDLHIKMIKENIYEIIKNIKFELKDKLKEFQGRISKETEIQFINKYYSLINCFSEILNSYNFLFVNNNK